MPCDTLEERMASNKAVPCEKPWTPVFPAWLVGSIAPGMLFLGMTTIGYGLGTGRSWAISKIIQPSTQLSIMLLLMTCDHSSSFYDHSRVANEDYCLTSMLTSSDKLDSDTGRMVFGALTAVLTAGSAYGVKSGSITLSATVIPLAAMAAYLAWSPQKIQSCKNNSLVTGTLAFSLDLMSLIGIMEVLLQQSGNSDTSWHKPTIAYSVIISALFVLLIGKFSDYGERIKPGSCEINDAKDAEEEKLVDRKPELYIGILFSVSTLLYVACLKLNFSEVSCYATSPVLIFLIIDIFLKMHIFRSKKPLVGDATTRSCIYIVVQTLDILLSSSSMIALMSEKGLVRKALVSGEPVGLLKNIAHFFGGSLTYIFLVARLIVIIITRSGGPATTSSLKRLAEVAKTIGLHVVANLVPMVIDQKNASYMMTFSPQNDLNAKCYID